MLKLRFVAILPLLFANSSLAADEYKALFTTMQARQPQLNALLMNPSHCLGERIDGFLEINASCTAEERNLAEEENRDRAALNKLMAADLGISIAKVGEEKAMRYMDRYMPGVLREVRISATEINWWQGYPPDPRKTDVYRVLVRQYGHMHEKPEDSSPVVRDHVQQYEAFGVVDTAEDNAGKRWYLVTEEFVPKIKPPDWSPKTVGWIAENEVVPWRRALVMRFTNPYQREPSLFFKEPEPILNLIHSTPADRAQRLQDIRTQIKSNTGNPDGVIASEPSVADGEKQEYMIMYPVLDFYGSTGGENVEIDGMFARLLKVAARTRKNDAANSQQSAAVPMDIIFVMDTTQSMRPYLEDVLAATRRFAEESSTDALRFGFMGYQDKDPKFDYETKEFTAQTLPAAEFVQTLSQIKACDRQVPGDDIPEAVFEGIDTALESGQWRKDAVKILLLVGDAPGREEKVLNVKILRDKAAVRQIRILPFHIRNTEIGRRFDPASQQQYGDLSFFFKGREAEGTGQSYLRLVDADNSNFRDLMLESYQGSIKHLDEFLQARRDDRPLPEAEPGSLKELIFQQASLLLPDSNLPEEDQEKGWVCDKALTDPSREALVPMILLNEAELEELDARVRELKEIGEKASRGDGGTTYDFFDLVSKNTRFTMVNPSAVNFRDAFSVPLGIDKLPYKSDIMFATRDDFGSPDRVQDFIRKMENKLMHYEDLKRQRGNYGVWKKLSVGAQEKDRVVGVALDQLP